ncbi:AraC family transcriptional regulator [Vibrio sp. ABG19]|uniref:AraC family transcriptional regulator n=1 Tax=Vibrio sp. ABG19 TaxID=2817385 RepID=UPI00249F9359|nr:AraC family transcriptional regulator [Vibrio sp. ABG19]WGY47296.1 AraC family transcriptional regulator [Vibrio sp. ABG19]
MGAVSASFTRICNLLEYIHQHLDQPLSLDRLSQQSCWSRWQLQRVFHNETGLTVANYVRELKLSEAAERLVCSQERVIDIALALGFSSEVSFSRTFKHHFGISPRQYRQQGQRTGLRKPLQVQQFAPRGERCTRLVDVRLESQAEFELFGVATTIRGLLSSQPDFTTQVPKIWQTYFSCPSDSKSGPLTGVIDVTRVGSEHGQLRYWATGSHWMAGLNSVRIPAQTYAVVKHCGPVSQLADTLEWFIFEWLPDSPYRGVDGFELERYPADYNCACDNAAMEYWLPITARTD